MTVNIIGVASVSQNSSTKSAMEKFLASCAPHIYTAMRIIVGLLFACHGAQKLFGVFGGLGGAAAPLFSLMGLAGIIEFFGGSLVAAGWLTGYIAFLASGEMAAAYFMEHLPIGFWPIQNYGELPVIYCFVFLYIASRGSGAWSVDAALGSR
jgi:putative oxidoreductase